MFLLFLLFFFELLLPQNPKLQEFGLYVLADIKKSIENNFRKNHHACIETKHNQEKDYFLSAYKEKIKESHPENKIEVITFKQYDLFKNKWNCLPGEILLNKEKIEHALINKIGLVILFEKAENLGETDKVEFVKDIINHKKKFDAEGVPLYFLFALENKEKMNKELEKANLFPISIFYGFKEKKIENKKAFFEKIMRESQLQLSFALNEKKTDIFLPHIDQFQLTLFFKELSTYSVISENIFYKTFFRHTFAQHLRVYSPEQKERNESEKEKKRIAVHEVGHAFINFFLEREKNHNSELLFLTGINNDKGLGLTWIKQKNILQRAHLLGQICVSVAGRAAEREVLKEDINFGSLEDFKKATELITFLINNGVGLKRKVVQQSENQTLAKEIDSMLGRMYNEIRNFIGKNKKIIMILAEELLAKEILFKDEFQKIIETYEKTHSKIKCTF